MSASNWVKGLLKAHCVSLVLFSSAAVLTGCGAGGGDSAQAQNESVVTDNNDDSGSTNTTGPTDRFQAVTITTQPSNLMVDEGNNISLSVAASGSGTLTYQWYFNGEVMPGKTSATLILTGITTSADGSYYCVISNSSSSATSNNALVNVVAAVVTGNARITWSKPTKRADGSTLSAAEIEGYKLYYSTTASGSMAAMVDLDPEELSVDVNDLAVGTHYFAMSTIDTNGLESSLSPRFSVNIN